MSKVAKSLKMSREGFNGKKNKQGINYWRFFFNARTQESASEKTFFLDFEMLNPWVSPAETLLGFKPRISFTQEDLQYALAGTQSAKELKTENMVQPSYCAVHFGILGESSTVLSKYVCVKNLTFKNKPFEFNCPDFSFSDNKLQGSLSVSEAEKREHPEYLCNVGRCFWDLNYEILNESSQGYSKDGKKWFPSGLQSKFSGKLIFNDVEYLVDPRRSFGYVDRYIGNEFPSTWFHISSSNIKSIISGNQYFDSSVAIQGVFRNKLSLVSKLGELTLNMTADSKKYSSIFDCQQAPEPDEDGDSILHWSASFTNKIWVVDVDIFCKIKDLANRNFELPEGNRKVLNMLSSGSGYGEVKAFKKQKKNVLELVEHVNLSSVICEYGHTEDGSNE